MLCSLGWQLFLLVTFKPFSAHVILSTTCFSACVWRFLFVFLVLLPLCACPPMHNYILPSSYFLGPSLLTCSFYVFNILLLVLLPRSPPRRCFAKSVEIRCPKFGGSRFCTSTSFLILRFSTLNYSCNYYVQFVQ